MRLQTLLIARSWPSFRQGAPARDCRQPESAITRSDPASGHWVSRETAVAVIALGRGRRRPPQRCRRPSSSALCSCRRPTATRSRSSSPAAAVAACSWASSVKTPFDSTGYASRTPGSGRRAHAASRRPWRWRAVPPQPSIAVKEGIHLRREEPHLGRQLHELLTVVLRTIARLVGHDEDRLDAQRTVLRSAEAQHIRACRDVGEGAAEVAPPRWRSGPRPGRSAVRARGRSRAGRAAPPASSTCPAPSPGRPG